MNRYRLWSLLMLILIAGAGGYTALAENSIVAYENSLLWRWGYGVEVSGDYAYYVKAYGLEVVDISDPINRTTAARLLLVPGEGESTISGGDICVAGNYAYLACRMGRFYIIDVSDPQEPFVAGYLNLEGNRPSKVTVSGNVALISGQHSFSIDGPSGVHLINVANPAAPYVEAFFVTAKNPYRIAVSGNYAYITELTYGLEIIDFSNPQSPVLAGSFEGVGSPGGTEYWDIALSGGFAFITDYANGAADSGGFQILSLSDPTHPQLAAIYDLHYVYNVVLDGTIAYVSTQTSGLYSFDVSDPAHPVLVGHTDEGPVLTDLEVYGDHIITSGREHIFIDKSDPAAMTIASADPFLSEVRNFCIDGHYAYLAHGLSGLTVLDLTDPVRPEIITNHPSRGEARDVRVVGQLAYLSTSAGMEIFNVADPVHPVWLGEFLDSDSGGCEELTIIGNLAYITSCPWGMYIVDVSDPANPAVVGTYYSDTNHFYKWVENINVQGNYAFISEMQLNEVHIIDVSDPSMPVRVSRYEDIYGPVKTSFRNNYALISGFAGTKIFDISNPLTPVLVSEIEAYSQNEPNFTGDYIIFPGELTQGKFSIFNLTNIAQPYRIGEFDTPGITASAWNVKFYNDQLMIGDGDAFLVMSLSLPTFRAGDANGDLLVDVGDAVFLINYTFRGGPPPEPVEAGDANADGDVNVGDAVYMINFIFKAGPPPDYR